MNKIMKYMGIAALALTGALMTSCGTDDDIIENAPQTADEQPAKKDNSVIVKLTVNKGAQTKALNPDDGEKTFAVDDQIVLQYQRTGSGAAYAKSAALTIDDIADGGKSATFTFELTNPQTGTDAWLYYPASMLNEVGDVKEGVLESQNGTKASVSSLDLSSCKFEMTGATIPDVTLVNRLVVMEYTLKDASGDNITNTTTQFTVSVGEDTYTVNRAAGEGPIYVAMYPTEDADVTYTATAGAKSYKKFVSNKTYAAGHIYPLGLRMGEVVDLSKLTEGYDAKNGDVLTGTLAYDYSIGIAHGATVTLDGVDINGNGLWAGSHSGIECNGDATIILKGTNVVRGSNYYAGISATNTSCTLTIDGDGSLTASSKNYGAGIGGPSEGDCANIVINGGTINATGGPNGGAGIGGGNNAACGNITINGGNVTAQGGTKAAGIGSGDYTNGKTENCGNITINGGYVTAQGGAASAGIGSGYGYGKCSCGNITINGGTIEATGGYLSGEPQSCGAGIGSGATAGCGTITIANTVTKVTARRGGEGAKSIGAGTEGTCGTVSVGGVEGAISESPYTYQP